MVKSYCVKQKKQTECVPGSEIYIQTKNNRTLMQCVCIECNIVKSKFVSNKRSGKGVGQTINKQIGNKIPGFQPAQDMASALMAITGGDKDLFKKYWSGDIARGAFNKKTGLFSKKFWTHPPKDCVMELKKGKDGRWHNMYDC